MIHTERAIEGLATAATLDHLAKLALVSTRWPAFMSTLAGPAGDGTVLELLETADGDEAARASLTDAGLSQEAADRLLSQPLVALVAAGRRCRRAPLPLMQAIVICPVQGSGKTTLYRERFADTHVCVGMDLLRTSHREAAFVALCLETRQPFVVDNTNPAPADPAPLRRARGDAPPALRSPAGQPPLSGRRARCPCARGPHRRESGGMPPVRRSLLLTVLFTLVLGPGALAAQIDYDDRPGLDMLRIVDLTAEADDLTIQETAANHDITDPSGTLSNNSVLCSPITGGFRCPKATSVSVDLGEQNDAFSGPSMTIPMAIAGGNGNDEIVGGAGHDVLTGGAGDDRLTGGGGFDEYFGENNNDFVDSTDGIAERISCGAGSDQVRNDFIDIIAECERGFDADLDGFSTAADCNDAVATIFPGARDILENGIDEDCDGRDAANLDRDADGFPIPADCNDGNPAIRPGSAEIRGNDVDENCDRQAEPFAPMRAGLSAKWVLMGSDTRLQSLIVRNAPGGALIRGSCTGRGKNCPFSGTRRWIVRRDLAPVSLRRLAANRRLRPGARITVVVSATGYVTRTFSYTIVRNSAPDFRSTCRPPGAARSFSC